MAEVITEEYAHESPTRNMVSRMLQTSYFSSEEDRSPKSSFLRTVLLDQPQSVYNSEFTEAKDRDTNEWGQNVLDDTFASNAFVRVEQGFQISRNIIAEFATIAAVPPLYFAVAPNGFATFVNLDGYEYDVKSFVETSPYSLRCKSERKSAVVLHGERYEVLRKSFSCTGVKACISSIETCSKKHSGPWSSLVESNLLTEQVLKPPIRSTDVARTLARQVFFFAQNSFPVACKHENNSPQEIRRLKEVTDLQTRRPNWVFKKGKAVSIPLASSRHYRGQISTLPDYIGCAALGQHGVTDPRKCTLVRIPPRLQGADPDLVNELVADARQGRYPIPLQCNGKCPPLQTKFQGMYCPSPVHEQEQSKLCRLPCDAEYHYFFHHNEDKSLSWVIVVGIGEHKHSWPIAMPPPSRVKSFAREILKSNPQLKSRELAVSIEKRFGLRAPINTVQDIRYKMNCELHPFGRSMQALMVAYKTRCRNDRNFYITSMCDETILDEGRSRTDQVGISIIMCNEALIRHCINNPRFACDGTFGVVSSYSDGLDFEQNSIAAKDETTGNIFAVMRQLASRKTVAARKKLFEEFVSKLIKLGMKDPIRAPLGDRLTMATDFETTYSVALGQVLSAKFGSATPTTYIEAVCFGCDVHAKRDIMKKCDILQDPGLYNWALGTRRISGRTEVEEALELMHSIGGKWDTFASWLESNKVAFSLWFWKLCSKIPEEEMYKAVFWDTNPVEAMHARLKSRAPYLLTNRRGLDLVKAVDLMEQIDKEDEANLIPKLPSQGIQYLSTPDWRRAQSKARKRADNIIIIDDEAVAASAPKRARKVRKAKTRVSTKQKKADEMERMKREIQEMQTIIKQHFQS